RDVHHFVERAVDSLSHLAAIAPSVVEREEAEAGPVVALEELRHQARSGMLPELSRQIADSNLPVSMPLSGAGQGAERRKVGGRKDLAAQPLGPRRVGYGLVF